MKFTNKFILSAVVTASILAAPSCKPKFYEEPAPAAATAGQINFSKYVAVGSGISAGFADNALFTEGQNNAYPALLAKKFREVNPSLHFVQPDINSVNGWSGGTLGRSVLKTPACSTVSIGGVALPGESLVLPYTGNKSEVTNLSVPFIRLANTNTTKVSAGTNATNPEPYYNRITDAGTLGIASEAKKRQASVFTVWLGYTDALRYATSGGTTALLTRDEFKTYINQVLDSLLAVQGSKGVIGNIPYVDQFPVVTNNNRRLTSSTDPAKNPVRLKQAKADEYNTALGSAIFSGAPGNNNYFAIQTGSGNVRQLSTSKDFIVRGNVLDSVGTGARDSLAVRSCTPNLTRRTEVGLIKPISNDAVLDKEEITYLRSVIDQYNAEITALVNARNSSGEKRLAVVDFNGFYTRLTDPLQGVAYGSIITRANQPSLGPDFGGFYSLDRIHPTPRGQSLIANEFLKVFNQNFGSTFSLYHPGDFRINEIE
jgi:hypothetical protein